MTARHSAAPVRAAALGGYDRTCDVLVVGFGCAGAAAAYEAAAAGARVLVLERAGGPGGSSALSGGEIYLGGGTATQRACGFTDTPDAMFDFLSAALGPYADAEKLRLYCDGSLEHYDWLRARGVGFAPSFYSAPTWMPPTEDGLMWLGENAWPYNADGRAAPRGHRPPTPLYGGHLLMEKLVAAATGAGAEVAVDTLATNLVVGGDGRVSGALARRYGEETAVRALRGVILTTGGFVDDEEMLGHHMPALAGQGKVSDGLDDGSGIRMGAAAGGALRMMHTAEIALQVLPAAICRGMLVNAHGRRFINEDVYPGLASAAAYLHQPGPFWAVVDEEGWESIPADEKWGVQPRYVAQSAEELEAELGIPAGGLAETVATYNRHAERKEDPFFHKDSAWLRPLRGPLAALDPRRGFETGERVGAGAGTGVAGFTLGGLHTRPDGAVLDLAGAPVPGLFAAGRASSGIHGENYVSGTSLGDGTFFGRRAGAAAAAQEPAD